MNTDLLKTLPQRRQRPTPRTLARVLSGLAGLCLILGATGCQDMICVLDPDDEHLCAEQTDVLEESLVSDGPVAYTGGVAYRVPTTDRVTLLRTQGASASVEHIDVPANPSLLIATPDRTKLIALSQETELLSLIDPETGDQTQYDLGSPFDQLAISPDGRYAIAFFSPTFAGEGEVAVLRNINAVAVIQLDAPPASPQEVTDGAAAQANPQTLTLRSLGSRPFGVEFAPPFTLDGQERRVAMILAENYVHLLELDGFDPEDPGRNETVVSFVRDDDTRTLVPNKVIWTDDLDPTDDDDMFAFVLTTGSDDVISLNMLKGDAVDNLGRPRVRPSLNQLTGGRNPRDMALFRNLNGDLKLLALSPAELSLVDVATSDAVQITLEGSPTDILVYQAINRDTDRQEPFAALYSAGGDLRTVFFVDLASAEVRGTRAVSQLNLDEPVRELSMTPDANRALILHPSRQVFSILNLERRSVAPLEVVSPIIDYDFSALGDERLITIFEGQPFVGFTDLDSGQPTPIRLDRPATAAAVVPETNTLVLDHGTSAGRVTLMQLGAPSRDNARTVEGFALDNLLEVAE